MTSTRNQSHDSTDTACATPILHSCIKSSMSIHQHEGKVEERSLALQPTVASMRTTTTAETRKRTKTLQSSPCCSFIRDIQPQQGQEDCSEVYTNKKSKIISVPEDNIKRVQKEVRDCTSILCSVNGPTIESRKNEILQQAELKTMQRNVISNVTSSSIIHNITSENMEDHPIHIHDLVDEVWFMIISYLEEEIPWRSMDLCAVFRTFYCVSKTEYARMLRYAKQVPHNFRYDQEDLIQFVWACRQRIKLGKVDFRMCDSFSDYFLCMHMLKSCNTLDLKILKMRTFWLSNDKWKNRQILKEVAKLGLNVAALVPQLHIPKDCFLQGSSCQRIQSIICTYILDHVPALRKICVESKTHELHFPLLTHYRQHLEDLTLKLFEGGDCESLESSGNTLDDHLEKVTSIVATMPKLKKLKINACFRASFRVRSPSLTKIDVRGCMGGFWITECTCPKLKVLRMSYYLQKSEWTGVIPLSKQEVEDDLKDTEKHRETWIEDYAAKDLPCKGLEVPGNCNIKLFIVHQD